MILYAVLAFIFSAQAFLLLELISLRHEFKLVNKVKAQLLIRKEKEIEGLKELINETHRYI